MNGLILDRHYNVVLPSGVYDDEFTVILDDIVAAREKREITREEADILISLALRKYITGEVEDMVRALRQRKPDLEAHYLKITAMDEQH